MMSNKVFAWCACSAIVGVASAGYAAEPPRKAAVRPVDTRATYLPLSPGDTWVFQRTVVGKQVLGWGWVLDLNGENLVHPRFQTTQTEKTTPDAEKSEETYKVIRKVTKDGQDSWEVSVTPADARDHRYEGYTKLLWSIGTDPIVKAPEYWYQEKIFKKMQAWDGNGLKLTDGVLTTRFLLVPAAGEGQLKIGVGADKNPEFTSGELAEISVPAGHFENCLEVTTVVKLGGDGEGEQWTIKSYYAKNIGMVKEVQLSPSGDTAYTLELKSFKQGRKSAAKKK